MTSTVLSSLHALGPAHLTPLVQMVTRQPEVKLDGFSVEVLSDKGITNPDGLFLFSGRAHGQAGELPWSLVLKMLTKPAQDQDPQDVFYWQREALAFQSGLLSSLPDDIVIPQHYAVTEQEDQTWIWMEHVQETVEPVWTLEQYALAAHQLGRFNGHYLTQRALPTFPWLTRDLAKQWSIIFNPEHAWEHPGVRQYFSPLRQRIERLWNERETFYQALRDLPQVFSHFDAQRRNLLIRGEEVVALDWALCGTGPVGGDLYSLIGSSCMVREWEVARVRELEQTVFAAYLSGLREVNEMVNPRHVRLAYTAWMALFGLSTLVITAYTFLQAAQGLPGKTVSGSPEDQAESRVALCAYALDLADEARALMG